MGMLQIYLSRLLYESVAVLLHPYHAIAVLPLHNFTTAVWAAGSTRSTLKTAQHWMG